ncbi:MAG: histidinol-phosphate transaminase [Oscillospiraceae bacterium]|nr:histidinol-phosphate transaminase [Oscillospiraceae bacterium]
MSRFLSERFSALEEYIPGEQPRDRKYIKLNTNESPYPPSPRTMAAVNAAVVGDLNLYPDPDCTALTAALAKRYDVDAEQIIVSNSSDDLLNFAFTAFCDGGRGAAFAEISYGFYEVFANFHCVPYKKLPVESDFSLDYRKYLALGCNLFLANPNAQTGIALPLEQVEEIIKSNPDYVVVVDEAYVDFGAQSAVSLVDKYENLLVTQTFSKSRSMAGARLGFAIGQRGLIADMKKIKYSTNPYAVNRMTLSAGEATIADDGYYMANCRKIIATREYTRAELERRGFFVTGSAANFLLASSGAIGGRELYERLRGEGILVRHFSDAKIENFVRITIGTREQMDALVAAVDKILGEANAK